MIDILALIQQYLMEGDILGFLQAIYIQSFGGSIDIFYLMVTLLFTVPLYIRTKSLLVLSIAWMLLGSFFIVAMPIVSGVAILLWVLAVGGLLLRVLVLTRS